MRSDDLKNNPAHANLNCGKAEFNTCVRLQSTVTSSDATVKSWMILLFFVSSFFCFLFFFCFVFFGCCFCLRLLLAYFLICAFKAVLFFLPVCFNVGVVRG